MAEDTYDILQKVIDEAEAFPNWDFSLVDDKGAKRLVIIIATHHNYFFAAPFTVRHFHPAPVATYNEKTWRRWLFDQCLRTANHEIGEALRFNGVRPFVPMHGPGEDPYTIHEWRSEEDALTEQLGTKREGPV